MAKLRWRETPTTEPDDDDGDDDDEPTGRAPA